MGLWHKQNFVSGDQSSAYQKSWQLSEEKIVFLKKHTWSQTKIKEPVTSFLSPYKKNITTFYITISFLDRSGNTQ